mmetsp:Transcript_132881/g.384199  ORF Transcript_132881/g.384199 Transcript_132881/m.384199 type:complete len:466 (+) Transcript_132881:2-1399(+)
MTRALLSRAASSPPREDPTHIPRLGTRSCAAMFPVPAHPMAAPIVDHAWGDRVSTRIAAHVATDILTFLGEFGVDGETEAFVSALFHAGSAVPGEAKSASDSYDDVLLGMLAKRGVAPKQPQRRRVATQHHVPRAERSSPVHQHQPTSSPPVQQQARSSPQQKQPQQQPQFFPSELPSQSPLQPQGGTWPRMAMPPSGAGGRMLHSAAMAGPCAAWPQPLNAEPASPSTMPVPHALTRRGGAIAGETELWEAHMQPESSSEDRRRHIPDSIATGDSLPGLSRRHNAWHNLQTMDSIHLDPSQIHAAPSEDADRLFTRTMDEFEPLEPAVSTTLQTCGYMGLGLNMASRLRHSRKTSKACTLESYADDVSMEEVEEVSVDEEHGTANFFHGGAGAAMQPQDAQCLPIITMDSLPGGDVRGCAQTIDDFDSIEATGSGVSAPLGLPSKVLDHSGAGLLHRGAGDALE